MYSLDSVFGDEGGASRRSHNAGESPAEDPSASPGDAPPSGSKTGGFSLDEFFAGKGGSNAASQGSPESPKTPGGSRTSGRTQRPPEDESEADQFQQWLKKLKS